MARSAPPAGGEWPRGGGVVGSPGTLGAWAGRGTPFIHTPWVAMDWPVTIVARDGMHTTFEGWARRKLTPRAASPSTTGVRAMVPPLHPSESYRCWSVVM